jgi:anti-sigma factor RsiW
MNQANTPISDQELHAYVDGTLEDERRELIDQLMEQDEGLAARIGDYFSLNTMLHERYDRVLDEPIPERLKPKIRKSWREAANWPQFAGMAAMLVFGVGVGLSYNALKPSNGQGSGPSSTGSGGDYTATRYNESITNFAHQAAIAHVVYAPDTQHPVEIGEDHEQDLVKWLSSRIGMDVRPPSLANSGFQLIGGRLLPGNDGPIAQFMYNDVHGQRVTLCISRRTTQTKTTAFRLYQDGPVNVFYWVDGDIGYAVSGGIDHQVLLSLAHDVYAQLTSAAPNAAAQAQ